MNAHTYDQIRGPSTTYTNSHEIIVKSTRRKGITSPECKIEPITTACQVCLVLDGLYICTICEKLVCINHSFKYNGLRFCKSCGCNEEYIPYIKALYKEETKKNCFKKLKAFILRVICFK